MDVKSRSKWCINIYNKRFEGLDVVLQQYDRPIDKKVRICMAGYIDYGSLDLDLHELL